MKFGVYCKEFYFVRFVMKIAFYTLGCKVNQYETQETAELLRSAGHTVVNDNEEADVYIVNSCTVTAESSRKSRQTLRRLRKEHPNAIIALTGCYAQAFAGEAADKSDADIIVGNKTNSDLPRLIEEFSHSHKRLINVLPHLKDDKFSGRPIHEFESHTRAFIKIQDGCNRYCTYCIIPTSKGFSRSKPLDEIKSEIENLAKCGYKELVFVGINLSSYGMDIGLNICDALEEAEKTDGIERIRLGSLEPDHITDEVIERLKKMKKFCPQFHLSLQSGCDSVLKRMNRHYTAAEYTELCDKLKKAFPDVSLTTDIIAGFPGETEEMFLETVEYAKKTGFMKVHVFPYSQREGTPAATYPDQVPTEEKNRRCRLLQTECDKLRKEYLSEYIGKTMPVLFETPKNGVQHGYTANYIPVKVPSLTPLTGLIKNVLITASDTDSVTGILSTK
jgi:threonylcarbamoyladenosine tRNA methylthiotransferase MtaB